MRFRPGDSLLAMGVVDPQWTDADLFVVTEGGYAKRTLATDYPTKGRGGLGVKVANLVEARGDLVGALVTAPRDEVLCIMASGKVVRSAVTEVSRTGRATQGVTFAKPDDGDRIIAVARSAERELVDESDGPDVGELADGPEHDAAGPDEVDSADSIDVVVNTAAPGDAETVGSSDDESEVQA